MSTEDGVINLFLGLRPPPPHDILIRLFLRNDDGEEQRVAEGRERGSERGFSSRLYE